MSDIEYSVITSDVIKSFDCITLQISMNVKEIPVSMVELATITRDHLLVCVHHSGRVHIVKEVSKTSADDTAMQVANY